MIWECEECEITVESDPVASDDWGGEEVAVGPHCPNCDIEMDYVEAEGIL